ncbi:MAG: type VI secretion system baseplate subunit TssE [Pseudomonadota bacterium]|nr:type VI secretion system baseplate subunit TssE [Pseudomonadota bacterium]
MAEALPTELLPSVLDRLLDEAPWSGNAADGYGRSLADLHESLQRDLQDLLNTRRRAVGGPAPPADPDALIRYGLPDFTAMNLVTGAGREKLRLLLEETIQRCETRLSRVRVVLLDQGEALEHSLRFRIEGLLRVEPAEPVAFASTLEPVSCNFTVKGDDHGR